MRIIDVLTSPWAIIPEKLTEIQEIYRTHLRGEKIDISVVEAVTGKKLNNKSEPYEVTDGVAIINIEGVLAKKMSLFMAISGGTSTQIISEQIRSAMADNTVKAILLYIDSPGGTVDGNQDIVNQIYKITESKTKPIISYTDGMIASAAMWIAAATGAVYISNNTAEIGSIGVVARHTDYSKRDEGLGIKTTEIYSGKYKRIHSDIKPLDAQGFTYIQDMVDYLKSVFVDSVAAMRGIPSTDDKGNLTEWAESKLFIGNQSIMAGLVDGVATKEELVERLAVGDGLRMITTERMNHIVLNKLAEQRRNKYGEHNIS